MDLEALRDILSEILLQLKILELKIDIKTQGFTIMSQLGDLREHKLHDDKRQHLQTTWML